MREGETTEVTQTKDVTLTIHRKATDVLDANGQAMYTDIDIDVEIPGIGTAAFSVSTAPVAISPKGDVLMSYEEPITQCWGLTPAEVLEL